MMKLFSLLPKQKDCSSVCWYTSQAVPGVRFALRRVSLLQRIELNRRLRELTMKYEFLKAGDTPDQLEAGLTDLLVAKLYVEWGVAEIEGLSIDGRKATAAALVAHGPENLTDEIVQRVQAQIGLTDDERKNS